MMSLVIEIVILLIGIVLSSIYPLSLLSVYGSLAVLCVIVYIVARKRHMSLIDSGISTDFKTALSPWTIMTIGLLFLLAVAKLLYPEGLFTGLLADRRDFAYFIPLYILGSLPQEFVFRGYYFARVKSYMNTSTAIILNIIIFSLFHIPIMVHLKSNLLYLSIFGGILWSIYYAKYPNLYLAWISHALVGSTAFLLLKQF